MNYSFLLFVITILLMIPSTNYSQRRKQFDKSEEQNRTNPKSLTSASDKSNDLSRITDHSNIKTRVPEKPITNYISSTPKNISKRPPRIKPIQPKKKQIIIEEYVESSEPIFFIEETIIYYETAQDVGYCEVMSCNAEEIEIAIESYPDFPLRFSKADIFYQFTHEGNDYYKISIEIEATFANYFNAFGVLIKYDKGLEQLILFNKKHEFMHLGNKYNFSRHIYIEQTGYMNLRLGYYDENNRVFYPEVPFTNKTDKLIFLENEDKIFLNQDGEFSNEW